MSLETSVLFGFFGLLIGSFLNVVIIRVPKNESIIFPSSHCTKCKQTLKWFHNIPILSWIFIGGRCSFCKEKISIQYPLVEFLTGFIFFLSAQNSDSFLQSILTSILFSMLLALSIIDLKYKAVPDSISLPALFLSIFIGDPLNSLNDALLFAGGFALLRFVVSWIIKKEAMGEADIIIAAIIGALLGVKLGLVAIYISALIALPVFIIVRKKGYELPYIPFLTLALFITWLFFEQILQLLGKIYG